VSWDSVPSPGIRDRGPTGSPEDKVFACKAVEAGGARLATRGYRWQDLGAGGDRGSGASQFNALERQEVIHTVVVSGIADGL
jgi:hypothetical protein